MPIDAERRAPSAIDAAGRPLILADLLGVAQRADELPWETFYPGVRIHWIYRDGADGPAAALIHFDPGGRVPAHEHRGYEHIFVLRGSQRDEHCSVEAGGLMVHPPGTRHSVHSEDGALVLAIYERRVRFLDEGSTAGPEPRYIP